MSEVVGYATIQLVPSLDGLAERVNAQLGPVLSRSGEESGRESGRRYSEGFASSIGSSLTGVIGGIVGYQALAAVGQGLSAIAHAAIGMNLELDNAQKSFTVLTGSASQAQTMLAQVKQFAATTPFDLPGVTNAAQKLLGAGLAAKDVIPTLKSLGDANAAVGGSQDTFNAAVLAYSQIATRGKLDTQDLYQIANSGVPIWQELAKALGQPVSSIQDLVSTGKLAASDTLPKLQAQLEKDYGGSLAGQANSIAGAWSNLGDSASTLTATAFRPLYEAATKLVLGLANLASSTQAQAWAEGVASALSGLLSHASALSGIGSMFSGVGQALSGTFRLIGPALGAVAAALAPLLARLPGLGGVMTGLTGPVGIVLGLIAEMVATTPQLQTALGSVFAALGPLITGIAGQLAPLVTDVSSTISSLLTTIGTALAPIVAQIGTAVATMSPAIITAFGAIVGAIRNLLPIAQQIITAVVPPLMAALSALIPPIVALVTTALPPLASAFSAIVAAIAPLLSQLIGNLMPVISALLPVVTTVITAIVAVVTPLVGIITGVVNVIAGILSGNWSEVWTGAKQIVSGVIGVIGAVVSGVVNIIRSVVGAVGGVIAAGWNAAWNLAKSIVSNGISAIVGLVGGLGGKISSALSGAGSWLSSVATDMWNGFRNAWNGVVGNLTSIVTKPFSGAISAVKSLLGIHSPSRVFRDIAGHIADGFTNGMASRASDIQDAYGVFGAPDIAGLRLSDAATTGLRAPSDSNATGSQSGPLVGSLTLVSTGDTTSDLDEVNFYIRHLARGGR